MSLQVWLPLNGDLHNQGLQNTIVTTIEGTPTFVSGKIGQCYQRATTSSSSTNGININTNLLDILGTTATVAIWVKPLGTHTHSEGAFISSGNWNYKRWAFGVSQDNTKVDVFSGSYQQYISCEVPVGEWTHLCSVYNNGECALYKNGIYIGTRTAPNFDSDASNTTIGRETYASGYFGFNGLINDVRIYDHCLSAKEIEEIAKGLVLHYKLDSISNPNLFTSIKSHNPTQYLGYQLYISEKLTTDTYTVQLWDVNVSHTGKAENEIGIGLFWGGGTLNLTNKIGTKYFKDGHADYLCFQIKPTSAQVSNSNASNLWLNIYNSPGDKSGTRNMSIGAWKLEKGAVATPLDVFGTTIYDSSGYNNNGTIVGNLAAAADTPRYGTATQFTKTSYVKKTDFIYENNEWTVSLWYFRTVAPSGYESLICLSKGNGGDSNKKIAIIPNSSYVWFKCESGSGSMNSIKINDWTHIVLTSSGKVYENGVEKLSITPGDVLTGCTDLVIGARAAAEDVTSVAVPYEGRISDVRFYATILTEAQIKELYNTSTTIDKSGNVYARELKEI